MPRRIAILGGGISGLTAAFRLRRALPDAELVVLERARVLGGKVRTTRRDGYTMEWGPNGFLTNASDTLDLARELGLEADLIVASEAARTRYLYREGSLRPIPSTPPAFLRTELVSLAGKLRAALEPISARRCDAEESVYAFVARHFGAEVAAAFAEAVVLGISAGDPHELSVDALFPRMRRLEAEHRSLVLGLIAARRAARGAGAGAGAGAGRLTSLRLGVAQLIGALERSLEGSIRLGVRALAIRPDPGAGFEIAVDGHAPLHADAVVLAVPAPVAARLVASWRSAAADALGRIPFAPVRVLGLGFDRVDVPRLLDGFGFLAPSGEGVRSLGALWSSCVFPEHAPDGKVLLRVLAGGTRDPAIVDLGPDAALAAVRRDLRATMGITVEPEFVEHVVWPAAIPQYRTGHALLVAEAESAFAAHPGIALTGYSYRGVGLNDCVREATAVAHRLAESWHRGDLRARA